MREIKFRCWDGESMEFPFQIDFSTNKIHLHNTLVKNYWVDLENVILMQYTGLKDKNGKEIYESDILRDTYPNSLHPYYEVVWDTNKWMIKPTEYSIKRGMSDKEDYFELNTDYLEVIGNIYENPEMIE